MKDYYSVLGLDRSASAEEIRKAYKKMAMQHHPDRGGDSGVFTEIKQAYEVLGDPQRRAHYDAWGQTTQPGVNTASETFGFDNFFNMFEQQLRQQRRSAAYRLQLWVTLRDVAMAGSRVISVSTPRGSSRVEIQLPEGIEDGDSVRYPGIGPDRADIVVTYRVQPDNQWQRQGSDITTDVVVPIWQLILGTSVSLNGLDDARLTVSIPPRTQPGTLLRLKGQGLKIRNHPGRGNLFVRIQTSLPEHIPDAIIEVIQQHSL